MRLRDGIVSFTSDWGVESAMAHVTNATVQQVLARGSQESLTDGGFFDNEETEAPQLDTVDGWFDKDGDDLEDSAGALIEIHACTQQA